MGRPGLTKNRKFLRLTRAVGNAPLALGCLELIWSQCYENGDDYLGDSLDVEAAAQWPGAPGALCLALVAAGGEGEAGFIDEIQDRPGHYRCHDLYDHAPEYVRKRMDRETARRAAGTTLRDQRAAAGRASAAAKKQTAEVDEQTATSGEHVLNTCRTNGTTPAPAPTPNPEEKQNTCAKPAKAAPAPDDSPVALTLPCVGRGAKEWPITQNTLAGWKEAFPGVDPMGEARKMRLWLEANPTRAKTHAGMPRFALAWMGRAQDSNRTTTPGATNGTHHRTATDQAYIAQLAERDARRPAQPAPSLSDAEDAELRSLFTSGPLG